MSDYAAVDLDNVRFSQLIHSHLTSLHAALLDEYKREVSSCRTEAEKLRRKLEAFESKERNRLPIVEETQVAEPAASIDNLMDVSDKPWQPSSSRSNNGQAEEEQKDDGMAQATRVAAVESQTIEVENLKKMPRKHSHSSSFSNGENHSFIQRIVFHHAFEIGSGCVILANTVVMALRLQYDGIGIGFDINAPKYNKSAQDTWPHAELVFLFIDYAFNCIFIAELLLRMIALRSRSLRSGWMWFDTIIVSISAVDSMGSNLPVNPGMLRVMRLARLVRLFKILKTMQEFDSLFLLQKAIAASLSAAVWSFAILFGLQIIVGLFLNQLTQTILLEDHLTEEEKREIHKYFGTFSLTILTMFEIIMANWAGPCRALVGNLSELFTLFFIVYRCFFCFAILKVIAAVFITETNRVLQHDDELTLMKISREKTLFENKINAKISSRMRGLLSTNTDDGYIDFPELQALINDPDVKAYLSTIGFEPHDLVKIFWLNDDGRGQVPVDVFLKSVGKMKGQAKAIDMMTSLKVMLKLDSEVLKYLQSQGLVDACEKDSATCLDSMTHSNYLSCVAAPKFHNM